MNMYHQYHHSQASTTLNATIVRGNDGLNRTKINMLHPMPSDVIQDKQLMTGSAGSQAGADHQDARRKFRAIMNASRRAAISSMMTLPDSAPTREGIRCLGEQPSPNNRWYSAPECQSPPELHRSRATYEIQELDIADSNILGMWQSSKVQETDEIWDPVGWCTRIG